MIDAFATLRQLLNQPPSNRVWQELLSLLEEWPAHDSFQLALDYAQQHLMSWPDSDRILQVTALDTPLLPLARGLHWSSGMTGPEVGQAISEAYELNFLTHLNLYHLRLGNRGLQFLALYSPHLSTLKVLELRYNQVNELGASVLARSRYLNQLESLDLSGNIFGAQGLTFLCHCPHFVQLKHLHLQGCGIGQEGLEVLMNTHFPNLESLNLARNLLRGYTLESFDKSPFPWPRLKHLDLRGNGIYGDELVLLKRLDWFQRLESMEVS